jgi:hypothetical protein
MVITNKQIVKNEVSLNNNDQTIERVTKMKYLQMMQDDALKLDDHVDYICKKMGRKYMVSCVKRMENWQHHKTAFFIRE